MNGKLCSRLLVNGSSEIMNSKGDTINRVSLISERTTGYVRVPSNWRQYDERLVKFVVVPIRCKSRGRGVRVRGWNSVSPSLSHHTGTGVSLAQPPSSCRNNHLETRCGDPKPTLRRDRDLSFPRQRSGTHAAPLRTRPWSHDHSRTFS